MAAWLDRAKPFAYATLGLRPWELLRWTLADYGALVEGYVARERQRRYQRAELAVWLIAPHLERGKRLTPEDLVGERIDDW